MRHEERQKLETDALVLWVDQAYDWALDHRRTLITLVLGAAGLALLIGGLVVNRNNRREAARGRLGALTAGIQQGIPGDGGLRAACETTLTDLERLAESEGGSLEGRSAHYYAGICLQAFGDYEAAAASFEAASLRSGLLGELATMKLAAVHRSAGKPEEAAAAYRSLLGGEGALPTDPVLFELGVLEEEQGRPEAAAAMYERLGEEHPGSAFADLAEARRERLAVSDP